MDEALQRLDDALDALAGVALWPLSDNDITTGLDRVHTAENKLRALKMRTVREIEGRAVPARQHACSPNAWLRHRLHVSAPEAARLLHGGRLLDTEPALDQAGTDGHLSPEHLTVIGKPSTTYRKTSTPKPAPKPPPPSPVTPAPSNPPSYASPATTSSTTSPPTWPTPSTKNASTTPNTTPTNDDSSPSPPPATAPSGSAACSTPKPPPPSPPP